MDVDVVISLASIPLYFLMSVLFFHRVMNVRTKIFDVILIGIMLVAGAHLFYSYKLWGEEYFNLATSIGLPFFLVPLGILMMRLLRHTHSAPGCGVCVKEAYFQCGPCGESYKYDDLAEKRKIKHDFQMAGMFDYSGGTDHCIAPCPKCGTINTYVNKR